MRAFLSIILLMLLLPAGCSRKPKDTGGRKSGPTAVEIGVVVKKDMPLTLRTIGTVEPIASVAVKAQVGGELLKVNFEEGKEVKKGDLLFTIQPKLYATQLAQAEANLARDKAMAASARRDLARQQELDKKGAGIKEELEKAAAQLESAEATVRADEALVEIARVQHGYTTIESPIDGRTGAVSVKQGNLIKIGDENPLVTIVQLNPIYVTFSIPESRLAEVKRDAGKQKLAVHAIDPRSRKVLAKGELTFTSNTVDASTGTITLKATFANDDQTLWPGAFVDVELQLETERDVLVVPNTAVTSGQKGTQVFVVKEDSTAELRPVTAVRVVEGETIVEGNLQPGEKVVTNGQFAVLPGGKVIVTPAKESAPVSPGKLNETAAK